MPNCVFTQTWSLSFDNFLNIADKSLSLTPLFVRSSPQMASPLSIPLTLMNTEAEPLDRMSIFNCSFNQTVLQIPSAEHTWVAPTAIRIL